MCLTASPNLNVKQCGENMQEAERKIEATGSSLSHITLWNKSRLESHVLIHWRTHTFSFCRKPNPISIRWVGHPNPNSLLLHCRSIPCLNTLVGSVRHLITLLKYCLIVKLLSFTQHFYIAELYPILTHCWGIPYLITWLSNSQILLHCWAIPNPKTC